MDKIVNEFMNGNKSAFSKIVDNVKKKLYVIAKSRLTDEDDIQDAIQETLITVYNKINMLNDVSKFNSWVAKILINNCNTIIKQKLKNLSYEDINAEYYLVNETVYSKLENDMDFFLSIEPLNVEDRTIIAMYYTEEYTIKEIGMVLNLNENTVKSRISRAKKILKDKYNEGGINNG